MANQIVDTAFAFGGWSMRIKSIFTCLLGLILIIFGLYSSITTKSPAGLFFSIIGIIIFIGGIIYWFRAKRTLEHKLY